MQIQAMSNAVMQPLQWQSSRPSDQIQSSEMRCLAEIQTVLAKYRELGRLGVAIIHDEFDIKDDEIMLETTDVAKREHLIRPIKKSELTRLNLTAQTTIVRFDKSGWSQHCGCAHSIYGHTGGHIG